MLNTYGKHQGTTTTVLRYLTCTVGVTLHERDKSCWSQGRIVHGWTLWTNVGQVMSHTTTTLHQLHLLLVNAHNSTIGIGITIQSNNKTIGQGGYLIVVANTSHRTSSRNNISEMVQEVEHLLSCQWVFILFFNASNLIGNAPMHLFGRFLIDISEAILHRILIDPYTGSKFIATEISQCSLESFIVWVSLIGVHSCRFRNFFVCEVTNCFPK